MLLVMLIIFLLGFILDFIEITLVVVPIVAPVLLTMGVSPVVWHYDCHQLANLVPHPAFWFCLCFICAVLHLPVSRQT